MKRIITNNYLNKLDVPINSIFIVNQLGISNLCQIVKNPYYLDACIHCYFNDTISCNGTDSNQTPFCEIYTKYNDINSINNTRGVYFESLDLTFKIIRKTKVYLKFDNNIRHELTKELYEYLNLLYQ